MSDRKTKQSIPNAALDADPASPPAPDAVPAPGAPLESAVSTPPNYPNSTATTPRWEPRQLATMALFTALGVVFSFVEIPLLPAAPFLLYDPANVPAVLGGLSYGAGVGSIIGVVTSILHGLLKADFVGALMNIVAVVAFVAPPALACRRAKTTLRLVSGLVLGVLASTAAMVLMNLWVTPLYYGYPVQVVIDMIIPILIPFNLLKATINAALCFVLYQSLKSLMIR